MNFHVIILTMYPEMFPGPLKYSLSGKALEKNIWSIETLQIRNFAKNFYSADDSPYGGGAGLVLKVDVLANAIDSCPIEYHKLLMSPKGQLFDQKMAKKLIMQKGLIFVCGHFEGVDERIINARGLLEISVGDYILSGGEIATIVILDTIIRLLPGVIKNKESIYNESFEEGLLEYPHYTRPKIFEGLTIPKVLCSGNHKNISLWRKKKSKELTKNRRPDLWNKILKNK